MKPVLLLALCVNLVFGCISYAAVGTDFQQQNFDDSLAPPALHIEGNRILDANGNDVILRGVWFSDGFGVDKYDSLTVRHIRRHWNANVIRLPIHPIEWRNRPDYLSKYVDEIVKTAGENGMYVVVGWHAHGNPLTGKTEHPRYNPDLALAKEALRTIATRYAKCRWVLYGTFNEPSFITWDEWRPVAEELTDVVNSVNPKAITLVSGVNWSHDLSGVLSNPVNRKNIIYEVHAYPGGRNPNGINWKTTTSQIAKRYPVMIGEWGYVDIKEQPRKCSKHLIGTTQGYAVPLVDFAQKLGIGWTVFVYSEYWEPPLIDYRDLPNDVEVLTRAGYFVREVLNNRPYHDTSGEWQKYLANQLSLVKNHFREIDPNLFAYERTKLNFHIRSDNYNQLYIQLQKPTYNNQQLPIPFFNFKIGYNLPASNFQIEIREGEGITDITKWAVTDKYGRALIIWIKNTPKQYFQISAMARQDQLILKGILGNISNIVKDVLSSDNTLSKEDKIFWRSKIPFFASEATKFIKSVE
jgi:endoglucanase